ncbi:MAG TPA: hypothetical protein DEG47_15820, partial [Cyanobacteria bacterium UBA11148]|nr:hypothetical protein [Cyanobacteria bacterium UBA11148]
MKSESLWQDSDEVYWLPALSLPTLLWARPFLPMMGLPRALVEQPEVWEPLYAKAVVEHETRLQMQNWAHRMQGERGELLRQVITKALFDLAAQLGQEVAIDLERWVRRHFLCNEVTSALSAWRLVLRTACYPPNSRCNQIPPPAVLVPILPQITNLVSFERINEIYVTVERVAPPLLDEQVPHETMEHCFEATLVSQAATQALTIKALQTIASKL